MLFAVLSNDLDGLNYIVHIDKKKSLYEAKIGCRIVCTMIDRINVHSH